jgi:hypothetical protein
LITRGYFIGNVIDELTAVSQQVKSRAGLQLTDLNRYMEDFCKEILNCVFNHRLINLNEERSNNPGLDLGDESAGVAFQITSTKTSDKVNETLKKAASQKSKFPKIYILILQDKQGSYTLDDALAKPFGFTEGNILDFGDIFKTVISLPIDRLQSLHDLIIKEVARVKIDLEIPDRQGKYQTNIDSYIEEIPRERFEGVAGYFDYQKKLVDEFDLSKKDVESDVTRLISTLKKLPRITRQFYVFLLNRGSWDASGNRYINADYLDRICKFPDKDGEIRLLGEKDLCWFQEPDGYGESATWNIRPPKATKSEAFLYELLDFVEKENLSLDKIIVSLDFSEFK